MMRRSPAPSPTVPGTASVRPAPPSALPAAPTARLPFAATIGEAVRLSGLSRTTLVLMDSVRRYVEALPRAAFGTALRGR